MKLAELQDRIQSAILAAHPAGTEALAGVRDSQRADRTELFLVYYEGYRRRLAEFVSNDYPMLREHLGDESFGALVEDYMGSGPSRDRNARWYASRLPEFMENAQGWRNDLLACGLARLERALLDAFDAADAGVIGVEALSEIAPSDWSDLQLRFHPSLKILDLHVGVASHYAFLNANGGKPPALGEDRERICVWRHGGEAFHRLLDADEAAALTDLTQGASFSRACAGLAALSACDEGEIAARIAGFMSQWLSDGLVAAAHAPEPPLPS